MKNHRLYFVNGNTLDMELSEDSINFIKEKIGSCSQIVNQPINGTEEIIGLKYLMFAIEIK